VEVLRAVGVSGVGVAALAKARDVERRGPGPGGALSSAAAEPRPGDLPGAAPEQGALQEETLPVGVAGEDRFVDRVFVPGRVNPLHFSRSAGGLRLLQQVRDEAHRFALTYHRQLRSKDLERSELDAVPGVGRKRKQALLTALGDVEAVRGASAADLARVPGIDERTALQVWSHFHREGQAPAGADEEENAPT